MNPMTETRHQLHVSKGGITRDLAVSVVEGAEPAILWVGGLMSDLTSTKAETIARWGERAGRKVVRFDYLGHGASSGRFVDGTISHWLDDTLEVIAEFCGQPPILVGSSLGGWISLLVTQRLAGRTLAPSGLVLIAPAVDFTETLMWNAFPEAVKAEMLANGVWHRPNTYAPEPMPIALSLIEDGRKNLLFGRTIRTNCPVHILQGVKDADVPYEHALKLIEHLPLDIVTLTTIPDGDHRLSRAEDLTILLRAIAAMAGEPAP
jgi:pimeloyl-ACP methyl ester carboxylesterase